MKSNRGLLRLWLYASAPWALAVLLIAFFAGELSLGSPGLWLFLLVPPGLLALVFGVVAYIITGFSE